MTCRFLVYGTAGRHLRLCDVVEKTAVAEAGSFLSRTAISGHAALGADVCKPLPGDLPGLVSVLVSLSSSLLLCCAGPKILVLDKALNIEQEVGELSSWFLPLMSSCLAVHQRCHVNNRGVLQPQRPPARPWL